MSNMEEPSHVVDASDHAAEISASFSNVNSSSDPTSTNGDARAVQVERVINIKLEEAIDLPSDKLTDKKNQYDPNTKSPPTPAPKVLIVVAALIATITFQAALNPPGGFIQEDPNTNITTTSRDPATAVLGDELNAFLFFDIIAFITSLSLILLFICTVPQKKNIFVGLLKWIMWFSVFFTAMALFFALIIIFPDDSSYKIITTLLLAFLGITGLFPIWVLGRFMLYLIRKIVATIKTSGVRSAPSMPKSESDTSVLVRSAAPMPEGSATLVLEMTDISHEAI